MKAKTGVGLIRAERQRQIEKEGWSSDHDDGPGHGKNQLAKAAISYIGVVSEPDRAPVNGVPRPHYDWPWSKRWWKPSKDPVRNLVKAGALIAAEIDRLLRKQARSTPRTKRGK